MSIRQLPHGVIKLISSTQVINSTSSVIKELIENAIDADATVIDIKLDRYGLDKIEIRDNGSGINKSDVYHVCLPNHTSKIYSLDDLKQLQSYGFRGEALNSLCAVSQLSIITKTDADDIASIYTFDNNGTVRDVQPSHQMRGTVVTVSHLFRNVPVRRQFFENTRKAVDELKRIEKLIKLLCVIHPKLRVTVAHNKCLIWHKTSVNNLRQSMMQVYPQAVIKNLVDFSHTFDDMFVEMMLPKNDCNLSVLCQPVGNAILVYINRRIVRDKKIEKVVFEEIVHFYASSLPANKCPLALISIKLPSHCLDVNLEPDKMKVFITDHDEVLKKIREALMLHFYKRVITEPKQSTELPLDDLDDGCSASKRRKIDNEIRDTVAVPSTPVELSSFSSIYSSYHKPHSDQNCNKSENDVSTALHNDLLDLNASMFEDTLSSVEDENGGTVSANKSVDNLIDDLFQTQDENVEIRLEDVCSNPSANRSGDNSYENEIVKNFPSEVNINNADTGSEEHLSFESTETDLSGKSSTVLEGGHCTNAVNRVSDTNDNKESSCKNSSDEITLSQWSKGHAVVENERLQGGVNIVTKASCFSLRSPPNENLSKSIGKKKIEVIQDSQHPDEINRSVSSQMGRKDMAGFTNFARLTRSEILKNIPGISFTKVANELATRWRNLQDDEKEEYKENAKSTKNRKPSSSDLKAKFLFKKKTLTVTVSIENIKKTRNSSNTSNDNDICLIGALQTKNEWLFRHENVIAVLNFSPAQKNVLYHRYLCSSGVPLRQLDKPIKITAELLGDDLFVFLLSLEKTRDNDSSSTYQVSDFRITRNGFKIAVVEELNQDNEVLMTEAVENANCEPIETLAETLRLALYFKNLEECRPEAIKRILKDKVVKACEESSEPMHMEVDMVLKYWIQCMLQKPIYTNENVIVENLHRLE